MPYSGPTDEALPTSVKKLPEALRRVWVRVFNENYDAEDEGKAHKMAWGAVRKIQNVKKARMAESQDLDDVKVWLYNEKASKTEAGASYPKSAYLYAPEPDKPSTWKLRIEETPGSVTVAQLGRAAAALGPGFRGNKVEMSPEDRASCARKLIGLYRSHNVKDEDIPDYLWGIAGMKHSGMKEVRLGAKLGVKEMLDGSYRWVMVTSGAFEDRDGEIMSTEWLKSAIDYANQNDYRGTLNFWHKKGTDIGSCDFQALVGEPPFLLESGLFDDTPAGRKAAEYAMRCDPELGGSIEFLFKNQTADGVYEAPGVIVRRSMLPWKYASFPWSVLAVKETEMSDRKEVVAEFAHMLDVSEDDAEKMLAHLETGAKELKDYGIRWKEAAADVAAETAPATDTPMPEAVEAPVEAVVAAVETPTEPVQAEEVAAEPAQAEALEVVITPETMSGIVAQVVAAVQPVFDGLQAKINDIAATLLTLGEQSVSVASATKELQNTVTALKQSDDAKIAEQVRNLPRATVKAVAAPQRPSQRDLTEEAAKIAAEETSMAERARKTLYG